MVHFMGYRNSFRRLHKIVQRKSNDHPILATTLLQTGICTNTEHPSEIWDSFHPNEDFDSATGNY